MAGDVTFRPAIKSMLSRRVAKDSCLEWRLPLRACCKEEEEAAGGGGPDVME